MLDGGEDADLIVELVVQSERQCHHAISLALNQREWQDATILVSHPWYQVVDQPLRVVGRDYRCRAAGDASGLGQRWRKVMAWHGWQRMTSLRSINQPCDSTSRPI